MSLYFIRHGESEANEQNLFAGRLDTPLTELGRRQAEQAGRAVASLGIEFDEIHVSPLQRARLTAATIERYLSRSPRTVIHTDLIERDFGILSEKNKSLIKKHYGPEQFEHMFHSHEGAPPEGESFQAMYERTREYYETTLLPMSRSGRSVLVVAHKYIIEMFALIAAGISPESYFDFKIPNSRPSSWDELARHVRASSAGVNAVGERVEAWLPGLLVAAMVLGVALRALVRVPLPSALIGTLSVLFLAVNSYIAFLRVESRVITDLGKGLRKVWAGAALRFGGGLLLIFGLGGPIGWASGTFLMLPPAMTAPTLSLMWGGDYFLSVQSTLGLSLISPIIIAFVSFLFAKEGIRVDVRPFLAMFLLAGLVPALAAQFRRKRNPIQSGATATNWGWVGGASLVPLALFTGYGFTPTHWPTALGADLAFSFLLFLASYAIGAIAARLSSGEESHKRDIFISHTVPNLFFWASLLPAVQKDGAIPLFSAGLFFLSIWLQEQFHVHRFAREVKAPDRTLAFASSEGKA